MLTVLVRKVHKIVFSDKKWPATVIGVSSFDKVAPLWVLCEINFMNKKIFIILRYTILCEFINQLNFQPVLSEMITDV